MFLYGLFQHMPSSSHKTTVKIQNYKELTYHRIMDMWSGEIAKRPEIKKNQPLSEKPRHLIITIRGLLIKIKHLVFLKSKLLHANTMIHYAAHLRYGSFVIPELTSLYFKHKERKDKNLRKAFSVNLTGVGFDPILVEYLTSLFPTSHLESYLKLSAHSIANIKMDTVVTSLSGVLDDPLLSFLIKNNNSKFCSINRNNQSLSSLLNQHKLNQLEVLETRPRSNRTLQEQQSKVRQSLLEVLLLRERVTLSSL